MINPYAMNVGLYLADGTTGGLIAADVRGWDGRVVKAPRTHLEELYDCVGMTGAGVFLLVGADSAGRVLVHVGSAAHVGAQIMRHDVANRGRGFWDRVVVVVSKAGTMDADGARYVASRLAERIRMRGDAKLMDDGGFDSPRPPADAASLREYARTTMKLLPLLGVGLDGGARGGAAGERASSPDAPAAGRTPASRSRGFGTDGFSPYESPVFHRRVANQRIDAHMQVIGGRHMLLKDSIIPGAITVKRKSAAGDFVSKVADMQRRYRRLQQEGSIVRLANGMARVAKDIPFTSPSDAAAFADGRGQANGRDEWVTDDGMTYGNWDNNR